MSCSQSEQMRGVVRIGINQDRTAVGLPLPHYATDGSAGMDLCAAVGENERVVLQPGCRRLIPTGIRVAIPPGFEGQVRARSGMALRHGVGLVNSPGTIDSDYRGELQILLINWGDEPFTVHRGDRIAQLVIAAVERVGLVPVSADELDQTARGVGGFGSTGVASRELSHSDDGLT